jgi:cell division protein FtsB
MAPPAAVPRTTRLTSRAAVLAVVICAIALSLAYPVREYIAQRRQLDELVAEQQMMQAQVKSLIAKRDMYANPAYIEQTAEQELHMCRPNAQCYVIENGQSVIGVPKQAQRASAPWYAKLWHSVEQSDATPPAVAPATGTPAAGHPSATASAGRTKAGHTAKAGRTAKAGHTATTGRTATTGHTATSSASAGSGTR